MKLFTSGELWYFTREQQEQHRRVRIPLEKKINTLLSENNYGDALEGLGIIPTIITKKDILKTGLKERKLYSPKKKSADYRLFIDYDEYAKADDKEVERLLIENMIYALRDLSRKMKKGFDGDCLERDILNLFNLKPEDIRERSTTWNKAAK